jgi:SanA protein
MNAVVDRVVGSHVGDAQDGIGHSYERPSLVREHMPDLDRAHSSDVVHSRDRGQKTLRTLLHWNLGAAVVLSSALVVNEVHIQRRVSAQLHSDLASIPFNRVALVLGTLPVAHDGSANPFFAERMEAAAALYCSGRVQHLILSGDADIWGYDEPTEMRTALMAMGVPEMDMTLDRAGLNTFESVRRMRTVFGQERFTIVSQGYHNERATYIAEELGADAVAFNAKALPIIHAKRTWLRERLARVKMWVDLLCSPRQR